MTKCLHCKRCNAVISFDPSGDVTSCYCGAVEGWWIDAIVGTAALYTSNPDDHDLAHIVSLHNGFLNDGPELIPKTYYDPLTHKQLPFPVGQGDTFWRQLHQQAGLAPRAPETVRIFDASGRACWAVIVNPGTTADTVWATQADRRGKSERKKAAR